MPRGYGAKHHEGPRKRSEIRVVGDVAYVQLTDGSEAMIDADDVPLVEGRSWASMTSTSGGPYAFTHRLKADPPGPRTIYMHRVIMGSPKGMKVDHIYHNTLDNRRSELRICENWQNSQNRKGVDIRSRTGVRGVSVHKNADGRLYYVAKVSIANYYPYTEEGLVQATERAIQLRARLKIDES